MFKYYINEPIRIAITSGSNRLLFPLHQGLINIKAHDSKFDLWYVNKSTNTNNNKKFIQTRYSANTKFYKLERDVLIDIPRIYFKKFPIYPNFSNCVLTCVWNDQNNLKSIEIIPSSHLFYPVNR
jgi:hypothetical protein